jgi:cytoskeletal protein CcmA (bactofilin family)
MIGKKNHGEIPEAEAVNAFLGRGTTFQGKINFDGMFRVDGKFEGEIVSGGFLVIGEKATVEAEINVDTVTVHGKLNGNIKAKKRIAIYPPGRLVGDIETPVLNISEGAVFEGNCKMGKTEARLDEKVSVLEPKKGARGESEVKES